MISSNAVFLERVMLAMPFPAIAVDARLIILASNAQYGVKTGIDQADLRGRPLGEVLSDQVDQGLQQIVLDVLEAGTPMYRSSAMNGLSDSDHSNLGCSFVPLFDQDGKAWCVLHYWSRADIFPPRNFAAGVTGEPTGLLELFKQAPGFMCVLRGPNHVFELANDAYYQLVGHREIIGHQVADGLSEVVAQGFLEKLNRVYESGIPFVGRALPIQLQRVAHGVMEERFIDLIYQPMFTPAHEVSGIFVQGYDVTEAHILAKEVSYQAAHDALTGLANRREFGAQARAISGRGPHALLYMDVDHFKIINDRCGHAAGDALLVEVSNILNLLCETNRDLLARLGGDEFVLLRQNCDLAEAAEFANSLGTAVKEMDFIWQGKTHGVTLSIGVVSFNLTTDAHLQTAMGFADAACFLAKELGRNRVQVSSLVDDEVTQQQRDMDAVARIKSAIREDRLVIYGQRIAPIQPDLESAVIFSEVLVRLMDLDGSIVSPSHFIPAAERYGLIEDLDNHVIRKTFDHIQRTTKDSPRVKYFINISGITLSAPGFPDYIDGTLAAYPLVSPSQICFEVTETSAISNIRRTVELMNNLNERGFSFALDDFGSGMATFAYLSWTSAKTLGGFDAVMIH
ncbi:diguanylate cyclase [Devosia sp. MC521]|uniref:diguanylate cyclase domain-containing protein n=1 Tax=Devosia sp. MC521 TaxID=2759954 RepID=UPI0015F7ADF9|nr:diguanylate cyclase [Devosia sp. MC521]MBJ6987770.1 diguanylate cyclase [Devosia sp. MC521]QMW62442.1 diguanylate cyclase [Devosia sp. MC521]